MTAEQLDRSWTVSPEKARERLLRDRRASIAGLLETHGKPTTVQTFCLEGSSFDIAGTGRPDRTGLAGNQLRR